MKSPSERAATIVEEIGKLSNGLAEEEAIDRPLSNRVALSNTLSLVYALVIVADAIYDLSVQVNVKR